MARRQRPARTARSCVGDGPGPPTLAADRSSYTLLVVHPEISATMRNRTGAQTPDAARRPSIARPGARTMTDLGDKHAMDRASTTSLGETAPTRTGTLRLLGAAFLIQAIGSAVSGLLLAPVDLLASSSPDDMAATMADLAANEWQLRASIVGEMVTRCRHRRPRRAAIRGVAASRPERRPDRVRVVPGRGRTAGCARGAGVRAPVDQPGCRRCWPFELGAGLWLAVRRRP